MEIKGRECKEVKIGDHSYWFIEKYNGGDLRKVRVAMTDENGKPSFTEKVIYSNMPRLFTIFCLRVDNDIEPTESFFDGLDIETMEQLQEEVLKEATDVFPTRQLKKKS